MSKKKPTAGNIRQGQTVYFLNRHYEWGCDAVPTIDRFFLYSHKTPLPPEGCILERLPVSRLKHHFKLFGSAGFYFSKSKARSTLRNIR